MGAKQLCVEVKEEAAMIALNTVVVRKESAAGNVWKDLRGDIHVVNLVRPSAIGREGR